MKRRRKKLKVDIIIIQSVMLNKELLGLNLMFEGMHIKMKMMMNLKMSVKNLMMTVERMLLEVWALTVI
jgi:hypothetical protein